MPGWMDVCLGFYDDNDYTYGIEAAFEEETETEQAAFKER